MNILTKTALLVALLGLGACAQTGLGNRDNANLNGGGALDPSSPAYFNETVGDRVLFAVDTFTLDGEARAVLLAQSRWLMENPEFTAVIEGHADERGTQEYNFRLGERRANSVMQFLISQGIDESRLRTISYGKERPLEICSEESCYRQNRRAVTVIAAGAGV